jgi:hypothetical protein
MVDFTQFFNPSAWGSWAPSASQALIPQRQPPPIMPSGAAQPPSTGGPNPNPQANMMAQLGMAMMPKAPLPQPMNISYPQPAGPGMLRGAGF